MIAGAIGLFAVGTAIYLFQAPKGAPSKKSTAEPQHQKGTPAVAAKSPPAGRQTRPNPKDGLMYVYIEPGRFMMGCSPGDSECNDDEKPAHEVTISKGFWLGQTPATEPAYQFVIGINPSLFKGALLPAQNVRWDDAQAHCKAVGMRLPTEAEWEYAARAGATAARYGNLDEIAWYKGNSGGKTHEVGQKQPNAFGLYDMLGNVLQWVADWYDQRYYGQSPAADPDGPARGTARVMRGGSWGSGPGGVRASGRRGLHYIPARLGVGFRCAGELH
jgi:formylglycine-generating enzyme required for sulfatase activity